MMQLMTCTAKRAAEGWRGPRFLMMVCRTLLWLAFCVHLLPIRDHVDASVSATTTAHISPAAESTSATIDSVTAEPASEPQLETTSEPEAGSTSEPESEVSSESEGTTEPESEGTIEPESEGTTEPESEGTTEPESEGTTEPESEGTTEPESEDTTEPEPEVTTEPESEGTTEPESEITSEPESEVTTEPESEGTTEPESEGTTEPESEVTSEPESEGTTESESDGTTEPEGEGTIVPESEGTTEPEGEGTIVPESEGTTEPEGEGTIVPESEGTTEPEGEGTTEPEGEGTTEPEEEGTTEPEGEGTTEPEGEGTTEPESEGTIVPESEGTTEPEGEGTIEPEGEGTTEPESEGTTEPEGEGTTEPESEGTTEPEGEGTTEPEGEGTTEPEGEGTTEPESEGTTEPESELRSEPESGMASDAESGSEPASETTDEATSEVLAVPEERPSAMEIVGPPVVLILAIILALVVLLVKSRKESIHSTVFGISRSFLETIITKRRVGSTTPSTEDIKVIDLTTVNNEPSKPAKPTKQESETFFTDFDLEVLHSLRNCYNQPMELVRIAVPAILSLGLCPLTLYMYEPFRKFIWPVGQYPDRPDINDAIACYLSPAGLVYATSFGFAFQQVLNKQHEILTKMTEEISMLDQVITFTIKLRLPLPTKLKILHAVKTECIFMVLQILDRTVESYHHRPTEDIKVKIWYVVDLLREVDTSRKNHVDRILSERILNHIIKLNSICSDKMGILHSRIHPFKWVFLETLGFFSFLGILLLTAYSYRMELVMCIITVFSISMLCYVVSDLDAPFAGFFRVDIGVLEEVLKRLDLVHEMAKHTGCVEVFYPE